MFARQLREKVLLRYQTMTTEQLKFHSFSLSIVFRILK